MMRYIRRADSVPAQGSPARPSYDVSAFPGKWINVNPHTIGVTRLDLVQSEQGLRLHVHAIGPGGTISWGESGALTLFAAGPGSATAVGFRARYDFGFVEILLHGNLNKGLLVLAILNRFKDDSGRMNYFTREYFSCVDSERYQPGATGPQEA